MLSSPESWTVLFLAAFLLQIYITVDTDATDVTPSTANTPMVHMILDTVLRELDSSC